MLDSYFSQRSTGNTGPTVQAAQTLGRKISLFLNRENQHMDMIGLISKITPSNQRQHQVTGLARPVLVERTLLKSEFSHRTSTLYMRTIEFNLLSFFEKVLKVTQVSFPLIFKSRSVQLRKIRKSERLIQSRSSTCCSSTLARSYIYFHLVCLLWYMCATP